MELIENLMLLSEFCKKYKWPRRAQWNHWIYSELPIAKKCVKRIGGRVVIDMKAFQDYVENASLEEDSN